MIEELPWPDEAKEGNAPRELVEEAQRLGAKRKFLARGEAGYYSQYSVFPPGYTVPMHSHDHDEMIVILAGGCTMLGERRGRSSPRTTPMVLHGGFEYGFTAGHEGLTFLTIRNGVAETTSRSDPSVAMTGDGLLAGRVALVTGGDAGIGRELAARSGRRGRDRRDDRRLRVARRSRRRCRAGDRRPRRAGPRRARARRPRRAGRHPARAGPTPRRGPGAARLPLYEALWCSQAAFATFTNPARELAARGGHLVFVTPTIGITGVDGLVPYATAVEGIRALAKSAARQWGEAGVRVNCVAPPVEVVAPELGVTGPAMVGELSLGRATGRARRRRARRRVVDE